MMTLQERKPETRRTTRELRVFQQEMRTITALQQRLQPRPYARLKGWEVACGNLVEGRLGGDYHDYSVLPSGQLALLVGDVSGHGVAAAMLVAQVRAFLRSCPLTCGKGRAPFCSADHCAMPSPAKVLQHLSQLLEENSLDEQFMTAFYGVASPETGAVRYSAAGHPAARVWRAATNSIEELPDASGPLLGIGMCDHYPEGQITLEPGDLLVAFTDGLTEAEGTLTGPFGINRLDAAIRESAGQGVEAVKRTVMERLQEFLDGDDCHDDVTLFVLGRDVA